MKHLPFLPIAHRLSQRHDVISCYKVFLGRNPENDMVVVGPLCDPVSKNIERFLNSQEFSDSVVAPRQRNHKTLHEQGNTSRPTDEEIAWLLEYLDLTALDAVRFQHCRSWKGFFDALLPLAGLEADLSDESELASVGDDRPRFAAAHDRRSADAAPVVVSKAAKLTSRRSVQAMSAPNTIGAPRGEPGSPQLPDIRPTADTAADVVELAYASPSVSKAAPESCPLVAIFATVPPAGDAVLIEAIRAGRLLDANWYSTKCGKKFAGSEEALQDFMLRGAALGFEPNALFDSSFYRQRYLTDSAAENVPFFHYVREGMAADLSPSPLVDVPWVKRQLSQLDLVDGVLSALLHKCAPLCIDPHPCFSVRFYLSRNPELVARRSHPVVHFINYGWREGRSPHPLFWPGWVSKLSGLAVASRNLLVAYLYEAELFVHSPNPYFDAPHYWRSISTDANQANPLRHYIENHTAIPAATPNPAIDPAYVAARFQIQIRSLRTDALSFLLIHENGFIFGNAQRVPLALVENADSRAVEAMRCKVLGTSFGSTKRKRVIYLSHNLKIQGAQTSLFELSTGMARDPNNEVIVLAPDEGPMKQRYEAAGVAVHKYMLPVAGMADSKQYARLFARFTTQIKDLGPDLLHGNTIQTYHAIAAAASAGIPTVWNIRESEEPAHHFTALESGAQDLLAQAITTVSEFAFVSRTTERVWRDVYPAIKSQVINNGINYDNFHGNVRMIGRETTRALLGTNKDEVLIYNVGTWTERKGQRDILEALRLVDRRLWQRLRVLLIGANNSVYGNSLQQDYDSLPTALRERIIIRPESSSAADRALVLGAFHAADIFAFTSRIESYPRVINEALYFGMPIVSTPCFGVIEQVEPGVSALFYDAGDTLRLARHFEDLIADPARRQSLSTQARIAAHHRVIQYGDMLTRYHAIYTRLTLSHAPLVKAA